MRLSTSLAVLAVIGGSQAQKINCNAVANVVNALKILKTAVKFCTSFNKVTFTLKTPHMLDHAC